MLAPALLLLLALAARAGGDGGSDAPAALRGELRRDNDDYAQAQRRSDYVAARFSPQSKYIRPAPAPGDPRPPRAPRPGPRRALALNATAGAGVRVEEAETTGEGRGVKEAERRGQGPFIPIQGRPQVAIKRDEAADRKRKEGQIKAGGEKKEDGEKRGKVVERFLGNKLENILDISAMSAKGEKTSSRTTARPTARPTSPGGTPRATAAAPRASLPAARPAPELPSAGGVSPLAKKRYEVKTRTPADPQKSFFKNESESVEKFNSLSSAQAPVTAAAAQEALATTRRTMRHVVTSVRATGVTAMRAAGGATRRPGPRGGGGRARGARARPRGERAAARTRNRERERERQREHSPPRRGGSGRGRGGRGGRSVQLRADRELQKLRNGLRAGPVPAHLLDMAAARGPRVNVRRLRNKLCDRHFLRPEGPKYDSLGRIYMAKFVPRGRGNYGFDQTRPPRLVLPRCCNCCRKSVLGCE